MKQIILFAISLLTMCSVAICQNTEKEYIERKVEYDTDSTGKLIIKKDLEYYLIIAKDYSSCGLKNKAGEIIIPLGKYKSLNPIDEKGMILAKKGNKEGFIDVNENILVPFVYDDVGVFSDCVDLAPVIKNKKQGFVNRSGRIVIPLEYDGKSRVSYFYEPGLAILLKNGKYGVIGSENDIIIPFEYNKIEWSDLKEFFLVTKEKELAIFSLEGKKLSDFKEYEVVSNYSYYASNPDCKNLPILVKSGGEKKILNEINRDVNYKNGTKRVKDSMMLQVNEQFGYIDKEGDFIVPFGKYDIAKPFGLGRKAIVANKGRYGIIDEYGQYALPLEYDFIEHPSQYSRYATIFVATKGNQIMMFDENVNIIPLTGVTSYINWNGFLIVSDINNKRGVVTYSGQQIIPFEYDTLFQRKPPNYIAKKENRYGYITHNNKIIIPFDYKYIYEINDGLVYVNQEGKVGMYDEKGRIKIPFEYDAIYDTWYNNFDSEKTRFIVVQNGKVGTIDEENKIVIPIIYEALSGWVEYGPEAHFARKDGKYGLISYEGDIIIPIEYEYVGIPSEGIIKVRKNGKYGAVSWKHKEILPCKYEKLVLDIPFFIFDDKRESKLVVLDNGVWKYFNMKGKLLQDNIAEAEIMKNYDYILKRGDPSNETADFHMQQYSIMELLKNNNRLISE